MRSLPALLQKFRDGKALTSLEQEWVMTELERLSAQPVTTSLTDSGDDAAQDMHDVVEFVMPPTVMKGAYTLNGQPKHGPLREEHHVYLELLRRHQDDILAYRELFESRGDVDGLKPFINWIAPTIPYRVVSRTARDESGACVACRALKGDAQRAA